MFKIINKTIKEDDKQTNVLFYEYNKKAYIKT